jgi:hypothetical protein
MPEIIRDTTSRWISEVPSKMVKILRWVPADLGLARLNRV